MFLEFRGTPAPYSIASPHVPKTKRIRVALSSRASNYGAHSLNELQIGFKRRRHSIEVQTDDLSLLFLLNLS